MDQEERYRIVQALTHHGFVDITNEQELIDQGKKLIRYSNEDMIIYSPNNSDRGLFLIEYNMKYYIAQNSLNYIINDFYRKIIGDIHAQPIGL
jgi:chaperone required for assembly of F1-ATPase